MVLGQFQYAMVEGVFCHLEPDHTLQDIPSDEDCEQLFKEAHEGHYLGHLREAKIYGQLSQHYTGTEVPLTGLVWMYQRSSKAIVMQLCLQII